MSGQLRNVGGARVWDDFVRIWRLKLQHNYHDGIVREVEYQNSEDISLDVEICATGNQGSSRVHLTFSGVRNSGQVKRALEAARLANSRKGMVAEIVGIVRQGGRGYLLDLGSTPGLSIDARGLLET
jgi:hypothetical protein